MKKIIIGLVGEMGAGKDTFSEYVKSKNRESVFCFRFSDPLSEVLKIFFNEVKRTDQQWLGIVLRERFGRDILIKAISKKIKSQKKGAIIILNGVRYWEEYKAIKKLGGKMVYITADSKLRWQRTKKRNEKKDDTAPYKEFFKKEKAETELQIPGIGKKSDFKIKNNKSKKAFYQKIEEILKELREK